jgi:hypothetical protein
MNMKLSFKKEKKETGLRAIAEPNPTTQIKADKKKCGAITPPNRFSSQGDDWFIRLMVKKVPSEADPCDFAWITLKAKRSTEEECREFIKKNWAVICEKYDLYQMDDD